MSSRKRSDQNTTGQGSAQQSPAEIAYIGLGSNLENPQQQLQQAVSAISDLAEVQLLQVSPFYQSAAVLDASQPPQPDYINAVAALETTLNPLALLDALQAIEQAHGRVRGDVRWQPRTLDLDILLVGQQIIDQPRLQVPHPELHKRAFVLYPLYDIAPDLNIPGRGSVTALRQACDNQVLRKVDE